LDAKVFPSMIFNFFLKIYLSIFFSSPNFSLKIFLLKIFL